MTAIGDLKPGDNFKNHLLCEVFGCGPQGGMRRSLKTNTLVLVSNHVSSIYDDRWIDDVMHYTGMGQKGDQSLDFMQNKTLAESGKNGVEVYLFEVFEEGTYTYVGGVQLAGHPYQEEQTDNDGTSRKVWVFPLALKTGRPPIIDIDSLKKLENQKQRQARRLTDGEVAKKARETERKQVGVQTAITKQHQRSVWVAEHAKRRASGRCELCQQPAPFVDSSGKPYLETHHIVWLARGGADTVRNTVALCANCHRRMHILDDPLDVQLLRSRAVDCD